MKLKCQHKLYIQQHQDLCGFKWNQFLNFSNEICTFRNHILHILKQTFSFCSSAFYFLLCHSSGTVPSSSLCKSPSHPPHLITLGAPSYVSNSYFSFSKVRGNNIVTRLLGSMAAEVASKSAMENLPSFSLRSCNQSRERETAGGLRLLRSLQSLHSSEQSLAWSWCSLMTFNGMRTLWWQ